MDYLPWIDIETTGLNPEDDFILEVGLVITDARLNVVEQTNVVITEFYIPFEKLYARTIPYVQEMHEKSGLWDTIRTAEAHEVLGHKNSIYTAELEIRRLMEKFFRSDEPPPMCGSSVGFDRSFLRVSGRGIESLFSYRNIDVSSIKELARRWAPEVFASRPGDESDKVHRPIPDILASIRELRHYIDSDFIRPDWR